MQAGLFPLVICLSVKYPHLNRIDMITQVKEAVTKRSHEYDIVIKRLHLYYDMNFGIDNNSDLIYNSQYLCNAMASYHLHYIK